MPAAEEKGARNFQPNTEMQTRYTFSYAEKLHLQKDFKRVFKSGRKLAHPAIFIYICPGSGTRGIRRMGLVITRKLGSAVERNRIKRRLREIFRLNKNQLLPNIDIIFAPRPGACGLTFDSLKDAVLGAFKKAGVLPQ